MREKEETAIRNTMLRNLVSKRKHRAIQYYFSDLIYGVDIKKNYVIDIEKIDDSDIEKALKILTSAPINCSTVGCLLKYANDETRGMTLIRLLEFKPSNSISILFQKILHYSIDKIFVAKALDIIAESNNTEYYRLFLFSILNATIKTKLNPTKIGEALVKVSLNTSSGKFLDDFESVLPLYTRITKNEIPNDLKSQALLYAVNRSNAEGVKALLGLNADPQLKVIVYLDSEYEYQSACELNKEKNNNEDGNKDKQCEIELLFKEYMEKQQHSSQSRLSFFAGDSDLNNPGGSDQNIQGVGLCRKTQSLCYDS